jgi:nitrous oxide reductase accessory protein NosL
MHPVATLSCLAALTLAAACGSSSEAPKPPPRTVEQQRAVDSTIGASNLPGARGVKGALAVSDSAAAKRRMQDSIATNP